jgi:hypothetical protein
VRKLDFPARTIFSASGNDAAVVEARRGRLDAWLKNVMGLRKADPLLLRFLHNVRTGGDTDRRQADGLPAVRMGLDPIAAFETQLLDMIGNLV